MGYYQECPLAKPGTKRKKKLCNGYKDKKNRICYYCGTNNAERHEVFGGSNRQTSIRLGFQVDLCAECHREVTDNTIKGMGISSFWKKHFQKEYEQKLCETGATREQAREIWLKIIGRNYNE